MALDGHSGRMSTLKLIFETLVSQVVWAGNCSWDLDKKVGKGGVEINMGYSLLFVHCLSNMLGCLG